MRFSIWLAHVFYKAYSGPHIVMPHISKWALSNDADTICPLFKEWTTDLVIFRTLSDSMILHIFSETFSDLFWAGGCCCAFACVPNIVSCCVFGLRLKLRAWLRKIQKKSQKVSKIWEDCESPAWSEEISEVWWSTIKYDKSQHQLSTPWFCCIVPPSLMLDTAFTCTKIAWQSNQ